MSLSPLLFHTLESFLVVALVLLAFGYKTRMATVSVLLIGGFLEALSAFTKSPTLRPNGVIVPPLRFLVPDLSGTSKCNWRIHERFIVYSEQINYFNFYFCIISYRISSLHENFIQQPQIREFGEDFIKKVS